jgi:hypothetical protein
VEDFWQHQPRDRRREGSLSQDEQANVHLIRRELLAEMQTSTTDVLKKRNGNARDVETGPELII